MEGVKGDAGAGAAAKFWATCFFFFFVFVLLAADSRLTEEGLLARDEVAFFFFFQAAAVLLGEREAAPESVFIPLARLGLAPLALLGLVPHTFPLLVPLLVFPTFVPFFFLFGLAPSSPLPVVRLLLLAFKFKPAPESPPVYSPKYVPLLKLDSDLDLLPEGDPT